MLLKLGCIGEPPRWLEQLFHLRAYLEPVKSEPSKLEVGIDLISFPILKTIR